MILELLSSPRLKHDQAPSERPLRRVLHPIVMAVAGLWAGQPGLPPAHCAQLPSRPALIAHPSPNDARHNVRMELSLEPPTRFGFREITIKLLRWPPGPNATARHFRAEIRSVPRRWEPWGQIWSAEIEIPDGSGSGQTCVHIPIVRSANCQFQLYEDGVQLPEFDLSLPLPGNSENQIAPRTLILDQDAPLLGREAEAMDVLAGSHGQLPDGYGAAHFAGQNVAVFPRMVQPNDAENLRNILAVPLIALRRPQEAPASWLDWASYDLVVISLDDLQRVAEENPRVLRGLRVWLFAGGNVIICGAGDAAARQRVERLLGPSGATDAERPNREAWNAPMTPTSFANLRDTNEAPHQRLARSDASASLVWRAWGWGRLYVIAPLDPFEGQGDLAIQIANDMSPDRWMNARRWGGAPFLRPTDYEQLQIPGVGAPPVLMFLTLITVFVGVIGPLNYWFLRRAQRIHWMMLTIPLGAVIVGAAIVAFAILTDGFGVRARIISVTELDQRSGQAMSWSRQAYYASSGRNGLRFPGDLLVAYLPASGANRRDVFELQWSEGQQWLRRGYLPTRQLVQFVVGGSQDSTAALQWGGDSDGNPQAVNHLGARIELLLVADDQGRLWSAVDVEDGQPAALLQAAADDEIARRIQDKIRSLSPSAVRASGRDRIDTNPALARSLLGTRLRGLLPLEKREFVAVLPSDPLTPVGVQRLKRIDSLQIVHGVW